LGSNSLFFLIEFASFGISIIQECFDKDKILIFKHLFHHELDLSNKSLFFSVVLLVNQKSNTFK